MIIRRCAERLREARDTIRESGSMDGWDEAERKLFEEICDIADTVVEMNTESLPIGKADRMVANAVKMGLFKIAGSCD